MEGVKRGIDLLVSTLKGLDFGTGVSLFAVIMGVIVLWYARELWTYFAQKLGH